MIDRKDDVINLCEVKYSRSEYAITAKEGQQFRNKVAVFESETKTRKATHFKMITTYGILRNNYSDIVTSEITLEDLFQ